MCIVYRSLTRAQIGRIATGIMTKAQLLCLFTLAVGLIALSLIYADRLPRVPFQFN